MTFEDQRKEHIKRDEVLEMLTDFKEGFNYMLGNPRIPNDKGAIVRIEKHAELTNGRITDCEEVIKEHSNSLTRLEERCNQRAKIGYLPANIKDISLTKSVVSQYMKLKTVDKLVVGIVAIALIFAIGVSGVNAI